MANTICKLNLNKLKIPSRILKIKKNIKYKRKQNERENIMIWTKIRETQIKDADNF